MENMEERMEGDKENTSKKESTKLPALYVSSLQTFETCGYFDASYKRRYPTREQPHKLVILTDNRTIKIIPTQEYGYANAVDLDYQRALFRIIDEQAELKERTNPDGTKTHHPHVSQPIRAQVKPFIRYAGRYANKRERKYLDDFLHRNKATSMHGTFEDPKTRTFRQFDVALFSQILTRGEKTKNGTEADAYLIWLTDYTLRLYYWHCTRKEDVTFHHLLTRPIGKVLYPYLDSGWFASLSRGGKAYTKVYPTLCHFLSITCYLSESKIREQLDPAHEELQQLGYLDRWEYRQRENNEWVVTWFPGLKWFEDARARGYSITPKLAAPKPHPQQEEQPTLEGYRSKLLADDILKVFPHDEKSRAFYERVASRLPDEHVYKVLADVQKDIVYNPQTTVRNPAAVFTTRIKELAQRLRITL